MKRPEPHEFEITSEQIRIHKGVNSAWQDRILKNLWPPAVAIGFAAPIFVALQLSVSLGTAIGAGLTIGLFLGIWVAYGLLHATLTTIFGVLLIFRRNMQLSSPVGPRIAEFERAEARYQEFEQLEAYKKAAQEAKQAEQARQQRAAEVTRQNEEWRRRQKLANHWASLEPLRFERELGGVYRQLGYNVQLTPKSGDHGIDLVLRKEGKTTVVQCKRQKSPAGERIARELLGSMVAAGADRAVLACTGGFTQPAKDFVRGRPIELLSAEQIARLAEQIDLAAQPDDPEARLSFNGVPICPRRGCGNEMVLRTGRYGKFWGCPKYPVCKGTRQIT